MHSLFQRKDLLRLSDVLVFELVAFGQAVEWKSALWNSSPGTWTIVTTE